MEELGSESTSHPLLLTVYRLTGVPNTGGSAIVYNGSALYSSGTNTVSSAIGFVGVLRATRRCVHIGPRQGLVDEADPVINSWRRLQRSATASTLQVASE